VDGWTDELINGSIDSWTNRLLF